MPGSTKSDYPIEETPGIEESDTDVAAHHPGGVLAGRTAIVIFGASGDVTTRKLFPALHSLKCSGLLQKVIRIVGFGRSPLTDEQFRKKLHDGVSAHARIKPSTRNPWRRFSRRVSYIQGNYDDPTSYRALAQRVKGSSADADEVNCLFYLATPPELFPVIVKALGESGLGRSDLAWRRIMVEKPFGTDEETCRQLNSSVHAVFGENQVYRIDHYLGKETVQNILTLRFANTIFEPIWNRNYIDHVQITVAETIGIESRAGYYESAGVIRDMVQSHVLQLVCLTAMEPPTAFHERTIRDEKVKVLDAVRKPRLRDVVWGQYDGYRSEPGVAKGSETATFAAMRLYIDNWRWDGVPFYIRTGKKLAQKDTEVTLKFKRIPLLLFPKDNDHSPNKLSLSIQPDEGLTLRLKVKAPGLGMKTSHADMVFHYKRFGENVIPEAYEPLLLDAMHGDATLFAREDEVETAWSVVDSLLRVRDLPNGGPHLHIYQPGSWGPEAADELITSGGRSWEPGELP